MITREKAIANVLRDYSRARDKGTRAATIERVLRMREEATRTRLIGVLNNARLGGDVDVDMILAIARGEVE